MLPIIKLMRVGLSMLNLPAHFISAEVCGGINRKVAWYIRECNETAPHANFVEGSRGFAFSSFASRGVEGCRGVFCGLPQDQQVGRDHQTAAQQQMRANDFIGIIDSGQP